MIVHFSLKRDMERTIELLFIAPANKIYKDLANKLDKPWAIVDKLFQEVNNSRKVSNLQNKDSFFRKHSICYIISSPNKR